MLDVGLAKNPQNRYDTGSYVHYYSILSPYGGRTIGRSRWDLWFQIVDLRSKSPPATGPTA